MLETKKTVGVTGDKQGQVPYAPSTAWIIRPVYEGDVSNTTAFTHIPVLPFLRQSYASDVANAAATQFVGQRPETMVNQCMEGNSLFVKYLTMKVQVDYPDGAFSPTQTPRPLEIIWGWVAPLNLNEYTTPTDGTVTTLQIQEHISNALKKDFNDSLDPMKFTDKQKRRYNIIGRRKVMPRQNRNVPTQVTYLASAAKIQTICKWPMMKKVRFTESVESTNVNDISRRFAYPNEAYLPFVILVNPDFSMYGANTNQRIKVKHHACMWYNDA